MFSQPELVPVSRLLAESGVTDLVINGHRNASVFVGSDWKPVEAGFEDEFALAAAARLLVSLGGRQLDQAHPFATVDIDRRLRVHAMLASAINPQTHLSIRVHSGRKVALDQLVQVGTLSERDALSLRSILRNRESFLISGSAGAGKTTLLRAMLSELATERIITIEDTSELSLESVNSVSLVTREPNIEGRGEISLEQLLVESLRMRPDRIVVGEVRGRELFVLLQAANTGHCAAATLHANHIDQVADRLVSIAIGFGVKAAEARQISTSAIDWVIHISRSAAQRKVEIRRLNE